MQAVVITDTGGLADLDVRELVDPEPGPNEAVVRVRAAALNYRDLGRIEKGDVWTDGNPAIPGSDIAGVVESVGIDVNSISVGEKVVVYPLRTCGTCRYCTDYAENRCERATFIDGGFAEQIAVPVENLLTLPQSVEPWQAATLPISYVTALRMLTIAQSAPGDLVFVPGATGSVGVATIQLAQLTGAETIGTSSSAQKLERLSRVGAAYTIEGREPDHLEEQIQDIGEPDIAINHLGGDYTGLCLDIVRHCGTVVTCGRRAGPTSEIDVRELYWGQKKLIGSTLGTRQDLQRLVELLSAGDFDPIVDAEIDLEDARSGFEALRDRDVFGKLLLRP